MKTETNKISLKEILNEKGLSLLNDAILKKQNAGGVENLVPKKPIRGGRCPYCDPDYGYAYIGGKCYCF